MNAPTTPHQNQLADDGRRSRFAFDHHSALSGFRDSSLPARALSQPPRDAFSAQRRFESPFGAPGTPPPSTTTATSSSIPWSPGRHASFNMNQSTSPSANSNPPFPARAATIRSLSFSTSSDLPSRFHPFMGESFPSTFEDDEDEFDEFTDLGGQGYGGQHPPSHSHSASLSESYDYPYPLRGTRTAALAAADNASRSRSQSLAATSRRQLPIGMGASMASHLLPGQASSSMLQGWSDSSAALPIMGSSGSGANYYSASRNDDTDLSNVSPFVRDLGQIHDETNAFRDYWTNIPHGGRDDGGASGTTSRRHSVSVVQQPRTRRGSAVAGFSAAGMGVEDTSPTLHSRGPWIGGGGGAGFGGTGPYALGRFNGGGRSMISDDELAGSLGSLALTPDPPSSRSSLSHHPSSLPAYALAQQQHQNAMNQQQFGQSPSLDRDSLTPVNGASPSYRNGGDTGRGSSVSPGRFTGRAISREREATAAFSNSRDHDSFGSGGSRRLDQTQYRQPIPGWDAVGESPSSGRAMQGMGPASPSYPSPTQRPMAQASRNSYGFSPVTSPAARTAGPGVAGPGGGGLGQLRTNLGMPAGGPHSAAGMFGGGPPRSPLERMQPPSGGHPLSGAVQISPAGGQQQQSLNELGRGVPLHRIASSTPMFIVEFKAGRQDIFFCNDPALAEELMLGDAVIVEADRGKDIGKITRTGITPEEVETFQRLQMQRQSRMMGEGGDDDGGASGSPVRTFSKEIMPKRLYTKASPQDIELLILKSQDEAKALQLCQGKVRAKKLPMEVVEAEYQWDRRKLTFYFVSDRRIDFRELVRELFRLYKTRIWMACLQGPSGVDV